MKLGKSIGALVAAVGIWAAASQASASLWVATYKGHLNDGYDASGVFGTAGRYLDGLAFTASYVYDSDYGTQTIGPTFERLTGDFFLSGPVVLAASLEIDGFGIEMFPGFSQQIESHSVSPFGSVGPGYVFHSISSNFDIGIAHIFDSMTLGGAAAAPAFLGQAVAETPVVDPFSGGPADYIGYFQIDNDICGCTPESAYGDLRPETYSVSALTVPEPATWGLMIVGFGAIGAALRARRRPAFA